MNESDDATVDRVPKTLYETRKVGGRYWLAGVGPRPASLMFIEAVVTDEEAADKEKIGWEKYRSVVPRLTNCAQWNILKKIALKEGIDIENNVYCTAVIKYLPDDKRHRSKPKKTMLEQCMPLLEWEIEQVKPDIIVCVGKGVFDLLSTVKLREADVMGYFDRSDKYNCLLYPIPHISATLKPDKHERFKYDMRAVKQMLDAVHGHPIEQIPCNYKVIHNAAELEELVDYLEMVNATILSVDCEWGGQIHTDGLLRSLQICWAPGKAAYLRFRDEHANYAFDVDYKEAGRILGRWCNRPEVKYIGHHVSADLTWMAYWLGLDWYDKAIFDSEFAEQCCDEARDLGLDALALRYTPFGKYDVPLIMYRKERELKEHGMKGSGYELIPDDILVPYACLRGDATVALADGTYMAIEKLYTKGLTPMVKCLDSDGKPTTRKVRRVVRNPHSADELWYKVVTTSSKGNGKRKGAINGPVFTPDHNIMTTRGFVPVIQLQPGRDKVITEYEALSHEQQELLFGSLLGDMGITQRNNGQAGLIFTQAARRAGYADWKAACLSSLRPIASGPTEADPHRYYRTLYSPVVNELIDMWPRYDAKQHKHKRIIVTKELVDEWLTDLALAVWYQDDGTFAHSSKSGGGSARIYFKSVNNDHEILLSYLQKRFGAVTYLHKNTMFNFSVAATVKLAEAISPYVHPDCMYKLPEAFRHNNMPKVLPGSGKRHADLVTGIQVQQRRVAVPRHGDPDKFSYCLEVTEAGNFLTKLGYVSNCKDVDTVMRAYPVIWQNLERQGLVKYYNEICNPFVTNVFTYWCLKGLPIDKDKLEEMRGLYNMAKIALEQDFRSAVAKEAEEMLKAEMAKNGVEGLYDTLAEYMHNGDQDRAKQVLMEAVGAKVWPSLLSLWEHYVEAPEFNIRSKPQMLRWLFKVKKYTPLKSTANKAAGMPSVDWEKVMTYAPEKQAEFIPATDKGTLEILASRHKDEVIAKLLELNAVGNLCKAFLKPADIDPDTGELIKENGIAYWIGNDGRIHLNHSTTETGRPRSH